MCRSNTAQYIRIGESAADVDDGWIDSISSWPLVKRGKARSI